MLDALHPKMIAGIDISELALDLAREHAGGATLVRADINEPLAFADRTFDVVTIFNVLYHGWVQSEAAVLAEAARVLRPGGLLLFTEPAFDFLRRRMDEEVMTRRRYRQRDFDPWLEAAGFETLFRSYFTGFGVPILIGAQLLGKSGEAGESPEHAVDMRPLSEGVNRLMERVANIEATAILHGLKIPIGTTLLRVARRCDSNRLP